MASFDNCKPKNFYANFGVNVYVHVLFLFIILSSLFMFYIADLTSKAANHELVHLAEKSIDEQYGKLTADQQEQARKMLSTVDLNTFSDLFNKEEKTRKYNNTAIFDSIKSNIFMLVLFLILIVIFAKLVCYKLPIRHILLENVIIFAGIGMVEFMFFKFIILKYIPVEPSFMMKYLIERVKVTLF
jgi:hypothetical protein